MPFHPRNPKGHQTVNDELHHIYSDEYIQTISDTSKVRFQPITSDLFPSEGQELTTQALAQRNMGNCFFVSTVMAMIAKNPELIYQLLQDNGNGTVTGRCFIPKIDCDELEEHHFVLDKTDFVSLEKGKTLHCYAPCIVLLEKLYLARALFMEQRKTNPSSNIGFLSATEAGGQPKEVMCAFTGQQATTISCGATLKAAEAAQQLENKLQKIRGEDKEPINKLVEHYKNAVTAKLREDTPDYSKTPGFEDILKASYNTHEELMKLLAGLTHFPTFASFPLEITQENLRGFTDPLPEELETLRQQIYSIKPLSPSDEQFAPQATPGMQADAYSKKQEEIWGGSVRLDSFSRFYSRSLRCFLDF